MELATAALSSLLPKLATLLTEEYKLQKRVRGEIRFLTDEMERMQAALLELSKLPAHRITHLDKLWARDLKELSYDIEDSIDKFMVRVDAPAKQQKLKGFSFRKFIDKIGVVRTIKTRHQVAEDIDDIKIRIREVADRRARYMIPDVAAQPDSSVAMDPRMPALYEDVKKLVGIDGPAETVTNLLAQGEGVQNQQLQVVSIVGVGGLGKTTLANLVYQRLKGQFMCQAFISVSLKPNMNKIFSSILRQVSRREYPNAEQWDHTELINHIRQILEEKRYIIVIDDLWDESSWISIRCALIDNDHGSRVIVTTRNTGVAKSSCSGISGTMYELGPLSDTDSKRLLYKRIFNEEEVIPSELEEVLNKILRKCGGIPLAIITIASMLASTPNRTKYEWYGVYDSMGSGLDKDKSLDNMRAILYLSYGDLPFYLKPCLLCLSMFPEDSMIQRTDLIRLWVAEGFVAEKQGSNLYELGDIYFNELVNRSMIQPVDMATDGSAQYCRVHDMILDLIISLTAEENFVTISEGQQVISPVRKIRRLSLQGNRTYSNEEDTKEEKMVLPPTVNVSHVRSIIAFGDASHWMPPLSVFSALRVLSLVQFPSKNNDPKVLGIFASLEISGTRRILDLLAASIKELPASIVQLRQLECLLVRFGVKFPDGIGNLTSLQVLRTLDLEDSPNSLAELGKLTELRELDIYGLEGSGSYVKTFLQSLSNLGNIHTLYFDGNKSFSLDCTSDGWRAPAHLRNIYGDSTLSELPRWFSSLSELSCLSIEVEVLRQGDLQLLGALPVLRFLKIEVSERGRSEERLVIGSDQPFCSLAEFQFTHYTRCWLVFAQGAMPKLQRLLLYFEARKREGGGIDVGLENLASLKHVAVKVDCNGARLSEVEGVETKVKDAIGMLPNHPTLELYRTLKSRMKQDENKDNSEASNQQGGDLLSADDESDNESDGSEQR
ncbi:hypothetical protein ACP70R_001740 [Stipagrostis hirtigluma subsp. patula]